MARQTLKVLAGNERAGETITDADSAAAVSPEQKASDGVAASDRHALRLRPSSSITTAVETRSVSITTNAADETALPWVSGRDGTPKVALVKYRLAAMGTAFTAFGVVISLVIVGVAVMIAVKAISAGRQTDELKRVGIPVTGVIIDNQRESRASTSTVSGGGADLPMHTSSVRYFAFRPVVRFHDRNGREVTALARNVSRRSFIPGISTPLVYHPDRADQVMIPNGPGAGGAAAVGMVVGVIALGLIAATVLLAAVAFGAWHRHSDSITCPPGVPTDVTCTN